MRLSRDLNKLICRALLGVFLFAQLAVSAYACPGLAQLAQPVIELQAEAMPGCDEMDQKAANLCAEHCKLGQQSHDSAAVPVVMAPALSLRYVLAGDVPARDAAAASDASSDPLLAATPPPHSILHCVFRI